MPKYTSSDVETLAQYFKHAKESGAPFALLTGAGCSVSAGIPGATALVDEINRDLTFCLGGLSDEERHDYGKCMGCLPEDMQRKLLKPYLDVAKVNWGHIAIAGLMRKGYVGRVLTFNFDNVLARACGLVGLYPATYDFAAAPTDTFSHISETAIMHLHGQGHGFFMFNSEEKTRMHAERLSPLLKDVFDKNPILVIGYSGASDSVFHRISTIFSGRNALFWAGHSETPNSHVSKLVSGAGRTARYLGGVDADRFLLELAIKLDCLPELFRDPYGHLLFELSDVTDYPLSGDTSKDVLAEVRRDLQMDQSKKANKGPSIADLFMEGKWHDVLKNYNEDVVEEADFAYWAQLAIADDAADLAHDSLSDVEIKKMNEAYEIATIMEPDREEAWHNWGGALDTLANIKKDVAGLLDAETKYKTALEKSPKDTETLVALGSCIGRRAIIDDENADTFESSLIYFKEAISVDPENYGANYGIGASLINISRKKKELPILMEAINYLLIAQNTSPNQHLTWQLIADAKTDISIITNDKDLANESLSFYSTAVELAGENLEVLKNAIIDMGRIGEKFSDLKYYEQSVIFGRKYMGLNSEDAHVLEAVGSAIANLAARSKDEFKFSESSKLLQRAEKLGNKPSYNLACILARQGNIEEARNKLLQCEAAETLPEAHHLSEDDDLQRLRDFDWFRELLARVSNDHNAESRT